MKYVTTIIFNASDDLDAAEKAQTMAQEVNGATAVGTHEQDPQKEVAK